MNEIATQQMQLPDTLEDLSKFVLVGREKLNAVRAEIRAIEKVQLAAEVHEQKLQEAQEIAEAVLDAETKLGELTSKMEQTKGARTDIKPTDNGVPKSKAQQLEEIGITEKQKQRYETLAKHPEQVEKAKAEARAEGKIVTRQDVIHKIAAECCPSKAQKAAQELREAEKHHAEYQKSKDNGIVSFEDAVQDKSATKLIFKDFEKTVSDAYTTMLRIGSRITRNMVKDILRGADSDDLEEIAKMAQEIHKQAARLMGEISEVKDEK